MSDDVPDAWCPACLAPIAYPDDWEIHSCAACGARYMLDESYDEETEECFEWIIVVD